MVGEKVSAATPDEVEHVSKRPRKSDSVQDTAERVEKMANAIKTLIECMGENTERDGLVKTPHRSAKALLHFTSGYCMDVEEAVNGALFDVELEGNETTSGSSTGETMNGGMVIVRDIEISSLCEHHLVPFIGHAHIGYIPKKKVLGLSKFARIAHVFAKRLQVQERLTRQIAAAIEEVTDPVGVGVVIECSHMCMCMRGVNQPASTTATTALRGVLNSDVNLRREFLESISAHKRNSH